MNSYWSGKIIDYSSFNQFKDILPSFAIAFIMSSLVFFERYVLPFSPFIQLIIQVITGAAATVVICELINFKDYLEIKQILKNYVSKIQ